MVLEEDRALNETIFSYGENNGLFSVEYTPDGEIGFVRGTQREYSSKPLKHSIVKRVLVFQRWIWAYFNPL